MIKKILGLVAVVGVSLSTYSATAATLKIDVAQDTSVWASQPDQNRNDANYVWVGNNSNQTNTKGMFGFDMSALSGLGPSVTVNSISFSAYHNYYGSNNPAQTPVDIALGTDDGWTDSIATYNGYGTSHGGSLNQQITTGSTLNSFITWDLGVVAASEYLSDAYLTLYLLVTGSGNNWNDFEPMENGGPNNAYLTVDYTVSTVPLPAGLPLYGAGLAVMGFIGWRRRQKTA